MKKLGWLPLLMLTVPVLNASCTPVEPVPDGGELEDVGPTSDVRIDVRPDAPTDGGMVASCDMDNGGCDPLVTCTDDASGPICGDCPDGYTGTGDTECLDIDECETDNGGCDPLVTCTNGVGDRTCGICPLGYTGTGDTACVDVDECTDGTHECDALVECNNTPGSYTCGDCPPGYSGGGASGCVDIDECATDNGGCDPLTACTNTDGARTCGACPAGYSGDGETGCVDIDECSTNPCMNGGACTDGIDSFTCACAAGYTGATCETNIDECAPNPCMNGGTCTDGIASFTCACPAGYTGATCETNIDECSPNPCSNGGTCTDGIASFTCACPAGFTGPTCGTNIDECSPNPCSNGGTCTDGIASFTCACAAGFTGPTCGTNIDECSPNPCVNGGTCTDGIASFTCACPAGFTGPTCATNIDECSPNPCSNGGTCTDGVASFTCACAAGFTGPTCGTNIDECSPNPCMNGGTCTDGVASFTCACAGGYSGPTCSVPPPRTSCLQILLAGESTGNGDYTIDVDGSGPQPPITVYCDMTTDGGGYTFYAITGTGISTNRFDQANSCTALGMNLVIPRTSNHYNAMITRYNDPAYFRTVPGIYGTAAGNYTGCAMNSGSSSACSANWRALDGGTWWLRDAAYSEPNGDYTPGCWLGTDNQFPHQRFNDLNCGYATGPSYICSTNDKGAGVRIATLTSNACTVLEHNGVTGDDRGGIAVGPNYVYYRGDSAVGRFNATDVAGGTSIGAFDAMISDLTTGRLYALSNAATPATFSSGIVFDRLLELDPVSGAVVGTRMLSTPVDGTGGGSWSAADTRGMYAGSGYMILVSARVYRIDFTTGGVLDLGARPTGGYRPATCENWAHWGVAEFDGTNYYAVYAEDWSTSPGGYPSESILRTRLSDGVTTTVATFAGSGLSDMCSITVSPSRNRWYFHFEGTSLFRSGDESIGFCDATFAP